MKVTIGSPFKRGGHTIQSVTVQNERDNVLGKGEVRIDKRTGEHRWSFRGPSKARKAAEAEAAQAFKSLDLGTSPSPKSATPKDSASKGGGSSPKSASKSDDDASKSTTGSASASKDSGSASSSAPPSSPSASSSAKSGSKG